MQTACYSSAGGGGGTPFGITFIGTNNSTIAATTFTFTSQAIGAADATRIVVVGVAHGITGGSVVSGVTIGGSTAAFATGSQGNSANGSWTELWYLAVPTGTTANIVVTLSATDGRCVIDVWSVVGTGVAFSTASSTGNNTGAQTGAVTASVPAGGGAIAFLNIHAAASAGTVTNGGNITTLDQNGIAAGATSTVTGAGHNTSASGSTTFTFNWTTGADFAMSVMTFTP